MSVPTSHRDTLSAVTSHAAALSASVLRLSQLQQAINAYRQRILLLDDAALSALQESYAPSRAVLLETIESLTGQISAGQTLTTTEAMELGRARELLRLIEVESGKLAKLTGEIVPSAQQQAVNQALERARVLSLAQATDTQAAARIASQWTALNRDAVTDLVGSLSDGSPLADWIERVVPESVQTVRDTLLDGVARGINPNDLARALSQATELPLQRAMTVARTETMRAYRSASLASYQENDDILAGWTWIAAHDSRTCNACISLSGTDFPLSVQFMPSHPRCLTGDIRVQAQGVKAVSKRWYSGRLIEIETMRGHRLTVTPNHPLLTPEGWIAAGLLHEGDDLFSSDGKQWTLIGDDNDEHVPPRVEEIANALSMASGVVAVEVPSATPHFHGDGMEGEIEIVFADCELGNRTQTVLIEHFSERHFVRAGAGLLSLASDRHSLNEIDGLWHAANSVMRGGGKGDPLFRSHLALPEEHALALIAWGDSSKGQTATNDGARYPELLSGSLFGLTGLVERNDRFVIESRVGSIGSGAPFSRQSPSLSVGTIDAKFDKLRLESDSTEAANILADALHTFPGDIALDRVVKLVVRAFEGHVYNLESENGYYFASGIITHNCRCSPAPLLKDDSLLPSLQTGPEWFAAQPEAWQRSRFPVALRDEFDAGRVGIEDMAHLRRDEVWGDAYQTATIGQARKNAIARRSRKETLPETPKKTATPQIPAIAETPYQRSVRETNVPTFKSQAEAATWAQKNLKTPIENLSKLDVDGANELVTAVARFEQRIGKRIPANITVANAGKNSFGRFYHDTRTIRITPTSADDLRAALAGDNARTLERLGVRWQQASDMEGLLIHETGHALDAAIGRNGTNAFRSHATAKMERVSAYAATKNEEAWAESFLAVYLDTPEAKFVPDDIAAFIRKLIGDAR